jgi:hypothetical protein
MRDPVSPCPPALRPRVAARHKLFEPVLLRHGGLSVRAHMLDLSTSGALLHAEKPPLSGGRVTVEGERLFIGAIVVWTRAKRFGLRFDLPIADTIIAHVLRRD